MLSIHPAVFRCICLSIPISLTWAVCWAQNGQQAKGPDVTKWKATKFQGKLEGMTGNTLTATTFGNERIFIYLSPYTKQISVKGTAEPSAIKAGMGLRFGGEVAESGELAEALTEIYLTTPDEMLNEFELGGPAEVEGLITGKDAQGNLKVAVNGVKKEMRGEKSVVVKRVKLLTVKLAENVKVNVNVRDASLAHKDDAINVTGRIVKANNKVDQPNHILAESVQIDLSQPLSGGKRKAPAPAAKEGEKEDPFKAGAAQAAEKDAGKK